MSPIFSKTTYFEREFFYTEGAARNRMEPCSGSSPGAAGREGPILRRDPWGESGGPVPNVPAVFSYPRFASAFPTLSTCGISRALAFGTL